MIFQKDHSLKPYNTFGLDVKAKHFCVFNSLGTLKALLPECQAPLLILGGGSNVLLTQDFPGTVLKNEIESIQIIEDLKESVLIEVGAGVVWHDLVMWSIESNFAGIENLSLIPGSVGAAPMQNIGAYGVELKSVFEKLEALEVDSLQSRFFNKEECQFGYRSSIFKGELKGKFIITSVYIRLQKTPAFNVSYGAIESELKNMGVEKLSLQCVSQAVINIRQSKLPNPKEIGNSGSFFKNPVISTTKFQKLRGTHPNIVGYTVSETETKVAAGWLIDQAGWKGYRKGDAGIHKNQALVLVNYGNAKGEELVRLSQEIQASVFQKFDISLDAEVNII